MNEQVTSFQSGNHQLLNIHEGIMKVHELSIFQKYNNKNFAFTHDKVANTHSSAFTLG